MVELRWVIRDKEKVLQYRDKGTSISHSDSGVLGTFHQSYDTGWIDVPEVLTASEHFHAGGT